MSGATIDHTGGVHIELNFFESRCRLTAFKLTTYGWDV